MSAPRYHPPSVVYWMLSSKCVDDQMLLAPSPRVRFVIMLWLSRLQTRYDVEIVGFVFMGDHFHIVLRLRMSRLPAIMQSFKSGLAKALNKVHDRRGAFWMERYHDDALLDDASVVTHVNYMHANPVRAHLVARADEYPGISSWKAYAEDLISLSETYFDEAQWLAAGGVESKRARYTQTATVTIGRPPGWDSLSAQGRRRAVAACVSEMRAEERRCAVERGEAREVPTVRALVDRDPRSRAKSPKRSARTKRASGTDAQLELFEEAYREVMLAYRAASAAFRATGVLGPFPAGTYPPRLMYALLES
ncbi:MAG: transposase [Deltaproteobacteria bacterium]|nr:transposase [Deltaproteobacteria bacterium]